MGGKRFNHALIMNFTILLGLIVLLLILGINVVMAGERVTGSFEATGNITPDLLNGLNWTQIHNIGGTNINWADIKVYASSFGGDHSGINWTSVGQ